jgi:hypothetical protein
MKVSTMISELQHMQDRLGDIEVLISDGWRGYFYSGNYRIGRWEDEEEGQTFIDIGIGGCINESD